jgi:hypothetical protein
MSSGVFIAEGYEEVDEARHKRSADITTIDVQALLEAFLITSLTV